MSSNKKFALSLTAMALLAVVAVVTIVAVFAAKTQQLSTNISVRYRADQIEGSVTAKYYVGPLDTEGTDMTTGEDGGTELVFHAKDTTMDGKSLSPQENIELQYPDNDVADKSWVVFEYVFHNGIDDKVDTSYVATMSFTGTAENLLVYSKDSAEQITEYSQIDRKVTDPQNFTVSATVTKSEEGVSTRYVYIMAKIDDPSADSQFDGNFNWSLGIDKATYEKLSFSQNGDAFSVKAGSDCTGEVIIPANYKGKPVTRIPTDAFCNNDKITSVTIGPSVKDIGSYAFSNCGGLTSITIGEAVKSIGSYAFAHCGGLTSVNIVPSVNEIGSYAFGYCGGLIDITFGEGLKSIGSSAFYSCSAFEIHYSGTLKQWCESSITGLDNLLKNGSFPERENGRKLYINGTKIENEFVITDDITKINDYAFYHIDDITSVTIGKNINSIGDFAFSYCTALTEINFNAINCADIKVDQGTNSSGVFNNAGTSGNGITVKFSDDVIRIPKYLFYARQKDDMPNITNVKIGKSIIKIEGFTFYSSVNIAEIHYTGTLKQWCEITGLDNLRQSETEIDLYINNKKIENELVITNDVTKINTYAFYYIDDITSLVIGEGVERIDREAFSGCTGITNLSIGEAGKDVNISSYAFYKCTGLTSLTIGKNVVSIGSRAFAECPAITEIKFNANNCKDLGQNSEAFCNSGAESGITVTFGENVTKIPEGLFAGYYIDAPNITHIVIGPNIETIGGYVFRKCDKLTSVTIGSNVNKIGTAAFAICSNLNEVIINSETIYKALSSSSSSNGYLTDNIQTGGKIKVLASVDDGTNTYLRDNFTKEAQQENIGGKMYNVYTKN